MLLLPANRQPRPFPKRYLPMACTLSTDNERTGLARQLLSASHGATRLCRSLCKATPIGGMFSGSPRYSANLPAAAMGRAFRAHRTNRAPLACRRNTPGGEVHGSTGRQIENSETPQPSTDRKPAGGEGGSGNALKQPRLQFFKPSAQWKYRKWVRSPLPIARSAPLRRGMPSPRAIPHIDGEPSWIAHPIRTGSRETSR